MAEPMRLQGGADLLKFLGTQADSIGSIFDHFFHYFICLTKMNRCPAYSSRIFQGVITPKAWVQTYYLAFVPPKPIRIEKKIERVGVRIPSASLRPDTGINH